MTLRQVLTFPVRAVLGRHATQSLADTLFRAFTVACAAAVCLLMLAIVLELIRNSELSIRTFGFSFLWTDAWNPVTKQFGAASSIYGTLVSTAIALLVAVPMGLAIALFLVELAPAWLSRYVGYALELLAAIPSIIYGMWGLFVVAPYLADHVQPALQATLGWIPLFDGPPMGIGMLTAGLILALMALPFIATVMRDVFTMVPTVLKEAAYGMGSTTLEVTSRVTIPFSIQGLVGAVFLGLARAIGETMAVTFVIGNAHNIEASLFMPGNSIASTLANEFTEASDPLYLSALVELGLALFAITFIIQMIAQVWLARLKRRAGGRQ
ncbi:MAG TPA: phosphate ABC transporter permease subunit PstC [bacterium]|nr:phosphate ABC transporter permease subunit PstC [bacterium]